MSRPALGRQPLDLVVAERGAEPLRVDGLVRPVADPVSTWSPQPGVAELADQAVEPALVLDRRRQVPELVRVERRRSTAVPRPPSSLLEIVHGRPPPWRDAPRTSMVRRASGVVGLDVDRPGGRRIGRRQLARRLGQVQLPGLEPPQQPPAGQVEVDRRDGDAPVDDGVEVGARDGQPGRRRAADPEVGDAARVAPLDELVGVDAPAEPGDLDALALLERGTAGTLTLMSSPRDRPSVRMLRATIVAASPARVKSGCS